MLDLAPIKTRLAAATPGPWSAYSATCCPDMGGVRGPRGSVCAHQVGRYGHPMTMEDAEFVAAARSDVKALVAEVERLRKRVLGSLGASARELSWRARYMDQLAIVAELQAELRERQRKDRAMLDYRATAKEAGIAQEKLPGALRELARENERLRALLDTVPVEFEDDGD